MCMIEDAEGCEAYSARTVKSARKPHKCSECRRTIQVGETYRYTTMVSEGFFLQFHTCQHCLVACGWLREQCGGWLHEQVLEDISEHLAVYPTVADELTQLQVGMRRKWASFDGAGLMPLPKQPSVIEEARAH